MKRRSAVVLGVGAVLGGGAFRATTRGGSRRRPHTDKEAVEDYLPELGPLVAAHWVTSRDGEDDGRSLLPSPDVVVTAVLRLRPGKVNALTAGRRFVAEDTGVRHLAGFEQGLSGVLPPDARWVHSGDFDAEVLSRFECGRCHLDRASETAFVRAVNPGAPDTSAGTSAAASPSS